MESYTFVALSSSMSNDKRNSESVTVSLFKASWRSFYRAEPIIYSTWAGLYTFQTNRVQEELILFGIVHIFHYVHILVFCPSVLISLWLCSSRSPVYRAQHKETPGSELSLCPRPEFHLLTRVQPQGHLCLLSLPLSVSLCLSLYITIHYYQTQYTLYIHERLHACSRHNTLKYYRQ